MHSNTSRITNDTRTFKNNTVDNINYIKANINAGSRTTHGSKVILRTITLILRLHLIRTRPPKE